MTHRGRTLDQYNIQELRDLFLEMFCTTKTAVDNPMMQPSGLAQRRSFLVLEEGELEGTDGYWAEDDEDGAEGFLDALEDVFWVYDDADYTWYQRRFQGRQTRRGKGKGKRKGKGKGRGGRRFFRSRKGKGRGKGRRKGRAHMVSEEGYEEDWQEEEEWNENYEGYWADDQNWNDGYWAYDDLYYMDEYGYFQRKGKGKGKGKKGKKGKDDDGKGGKPGDGKGKSNYVQPQTTSTPAIQNQQTQQAHYSSTASSSGHGFFAFARTEPLRVDVAETEPARVDVLTSTYEQQEVQRRTRRGGQNQRDATAQQNRRRFPVLVGDLDALRRGVQRRPARVPRQVGLQEGEASWKPLAKGTSLFSYGCSTEIEVPSQQSAFSFHTVQTDLACEKGLAFHTENSAPPTVCILDLGCTRAMGSRRAVEAFCRYVDSHPNSGLWYEIQPTSSRFFFANSQQSKCTEKLVIFMYDHGWNTQFTEFDIVEEGDVPLLMSLPQMRNLGFQFELTPEKAYLSCARIGMRKMVLKTAISTHLILDLQDVAWYMSQVHFKTPQVKSFFSQHDHFEYSQIAVKQDVHEEEEALVTGDYWQVDPLRRELIRHHKDKRKNLHEMN